MSANTPNEILEVLTDASQSPLGFPPEQVDKARALLNAGDAAKVEELEALPEPLALAVLEGSVRRSSAAIADAPLDSAWKGRSRSANGYAMSSPGASQRTAGPRFPNGRKRPRRSRQ